MQGLQLPLSYRLDPGADDDGVTVTVPQEGLNQLDSQRLGWLVPGLIENKIEALIRTLPKESRRALVPIPETASRVAQAVRFGGWFLRGSGGRGYRTGDRNRRAEIRISGRIASLSSANADPNY